MKKSKLKVLVLRVCAPDMTSNNGKFKYPTKGIVKAPDWDPKPECGNGLHGWLWGEGDLSVASGVENPDAKWLVLEVDAASVVELGGKVKFPSGKIVYCGSRVRCGQPDQGLGPARPGRPFCERDRGLSRERHRGLRRESRPWSRTGSW